MTNKKLEDKGYMIGSGFGLFVSIVVSFVLHLLAYTIYTKLGFTDVQLFFLIIVTIRELKYYFIYLNDKLND